MIEKKQAIEGTNEVSVFLYHWEHANVPQATTSVIVFTIKGKKPTLTMTILYDDVEAILSCKLTLSLGPSDPPITSDTFFTTSVLHRQSMMS
jgi:hypothetical protein